MNITGLSKSAVLAALYNAAKPQGMGFLHYKPEPMRHLINRRSMENGSDTPDFILAAYLMACLDAYGKAVRERDRWFSFNPWGKDSDVNLPPPGEGNV